MTGEPLYRWQVEDHRAGRRWSGESPTMAGAKTAAEDQVKAIGRGLVAIGATIVDPDGEGGGAARLQPGGRIHWVRWRRERV